MKEKNVHIGFECVRPNEIDARLILNWRNDPETLRSSLHTTPKVWPAFYEEFIFDYFTFPELPPLFVLYEGKRAAFLRFKPIANPTGTDRACCDVSINVAPEFRNKGVGTAALREIKGWLALRGYEDIYAEVKKGNAVSQKAFEKAGFIKLRDNVKLVEDTGEEVEVCRYIFELVSDSVRSPRVFIIAEAGSNWRMGTPKRDLAMAKILIKAAVDAGADAVKFQTYRPETVYVPNAGQSAYLADAGIQEEMHAIFEDLSMPYEMIPELASYCKEQGIAFMSSPFSPADFKAVDPYVPIHKIASYEIGHIHLLELAAKSGKPLVLSTGAATEGEIAWAVETFRKFGGGHLTLLQCTACYPVEANAMHLRAIPWLQHRFGVSAGLSDHSRHPFCAAIGAVALGAKVIEKHFTLHNDLPGPDHAYAINTSELKELVRSIRLTEQMLGIPVKTVDPTEMELRLFCRRGIQATRDIAKGETLKEGVNIAILRPGVQQLGIYPRYITELEGKYASKSIPLGRGIQIGDWEP